LSSRNTHPVYHKPSQVQEQMAHILFFQPLTTMLCEGPQEQVFRGEVLTPGPKKMLAGHYRHAEFRGSGLNGK
jgi:hypothetical protein